MGVGGDGHTVEDEGGGGRKGGDLDGLSNTDLGVAYSYAPPIKRNIVVSGGITGQYTFTVWYDPLVTSHGLRWIREKFNGGPCHVLPKGGPRPD